MVESRKTLRLYTYIVVAFLYIPIIVMIINSFNASRYANTWGGFTVKWYTQLVHDTRAHNAFMNSLTVALASAGLSITLAYLAARGSRGIAARIAETSSFPPLVMPDIAEAISLLVFLTIINMRFGWTTVFIGHTAFNVAYAYLVLAPSLRGIGRYEQAARTLGADFKHVLLRISLPLSLPALGVAAALTFILSFTDFIKTLFTKGPGFETLPLLIWNRARRPGLTEYSSQNALNALATLLVAATIAAVLVYIFYTTRRGRRSSP